MLIGRETETARLEQLLAAARLGTSSALLLRGVAGIGKTAQESASSDAWSNQPASSSSASTVAGGQAPAELVAAAP